MTKASGPVYIMYPRGVRTGGPEALHQLGNALQQLGIPAFLVPFAQTRGAERVPEYDIYQMPEAAEVPDRPQNTVVVPEPWYFELSKFKMARRFSWWLSIDKSAMFRAKFALRNPSELTAAGRRDRSVMLASSVAAAARSRLIRHHKIHHLAQSMYAWSYVHSSLGVVPSMLSDYTLLPPPGDSPSIGDRSRRICYNAAKGGHWIDQLTEADDFGCEWIPIRNMTRAQVTETLRSSLLYLDLGTQPGKDRLPREAAANGAITIVRRRGAGAYFLDTPIPSDHKIPDSNETSSLMDSAREIIGRVLSDVERHFNRQDLYRRTIREEPERFLLQTRRVFVEGNEGIDWESEIV